MLQYGRYNNIIIINYTIYNVIIYAYKYKYKLYSDFTATATDILL